jgi:hypothetical protein
MIQTLRLVSSSVSEAVTMSQAGARGGSVGNLQE